MRSVFLSAVTTCGLLAASTASAGLLGQQIDFTYLYTDFLVLDPLTVGNGVEVTCDSRLPGGGNFRACGLFNGAVTSFNAVAVQTIDVGDMDIAYALRGATAAFQGFDFNAVIFSNLDLGAPIGGAVLSTNIAGMTSARVSFSASSVAVDLRGLTVSDGHGWRVTLLPVPEPSPAALLFGGLAVMAATARYRHRGHRAQHIGSAPLAPS